MLMLLFWVKEEPWAIAATDIESLLPLVALQPVQGKLHNPALTGWINCHGSMIPAIDLSKQVADAPAPLQLSTRIAVVTLPLSPRRIGLILERAGEMADLNNPVDLPTQSFYTQALFKDSGGAVVQRLAIAPLFELAFRPVNQTDVDLQMQSVSK
ncbi:MAG: chemotaxis protein CheW [Phormidesmis sp.]